ncbi:MULTISPECIES: protease modulator HflC [Treponema]|uniref:Protein HflC n=1 Tax=Treponema porcinum TaxID=261392 RepID=A0A1T4LZL9_TREPO|nr:MULTISPECIES: protease modulator HflC [Treponema]MCI5644241.1 protease modulator HflC [Treponema porcinum]MCI6815671.1 protease modulator HflC [Treponema porcinum]MDD7125388.1 protease modulator HflC [Treponema porcinum]MDY4468140.1 protease modulator HflC [Treponema porcinum]MDY5454631.1 protease modulator HflC [Treponema porcinum]
MTKQNKKFFITLAAAAAVVVIFLMMGPFYIINEGYQAVVTRFGGIVSTHTEAGLYFRIPFIDQVTTYPKLVLSLDGDSQRIPTKENQFIIVDTTSRWKITSPAKFYQSFKTLDNAYNKLSDIIDSSTRTVITQNRLSEIVRSSNIINERTAIQADDKDEETKEIESLVNVNNVNESVSKGRNELCRQMTAEANKLVPEYGIELIDIVPRQIKYSDELTESVYNRMIKERNQVAQAYRSLGEGKKAEWMGKLENEKRTIQSEAYRKSEEIKGEADAKAARIYAEAYNKDPEFYNFWKSMESYKSTLKDSNATYSTNMDYFKYLYSPNGR